MKTGFLSKFFATLMTSILAFYAPIYTTLLVVFLVISLRFFLDILITYKSKKSRGTKCEMYKDAGSNFFNFFIAYLLILVLMYPTDVHLLAFFGSKHFIVTRATALLIIIYEGILINIRSKTISGKSLSERAMEAVGAVLKIKNLKNKIEE